MRYLRTYESIRNIKDSDLEPEVIKIRDFLKQAILDTYHSYNNLRFIEIEKEEENDKTIYSIIFSHIVDYIIIQFDYKKDEVWIKYHSSCSPELQKKINSLYGFFNSVAKKFPDYETGWVFDKETIRSKFENFDMYMEANKYNL